MIKICELKNSGTASKTPSLPRSKLASSLTDYEDLLLKHEQLASRHEQLLRDSDERREGLERAMREEATRHSLQSQEQTELIIQLRYEIKEVTKAFKVQLHGLQEEHNKVKTIINNTV